jgi:predicted transcriptional regulator
MPTGYSMFTAEAIRNANQELLGVKLGRICVRDDIPVKDVAEFFGVSRMTVYSWFKGDAIVSGKHVERMKKLIEKLA